MPACVLSCLHRVHMLSTAHVCACNHMPTAMGCVCAVCVCVGYVCSLGTIEPCTCLCVRSVRTTSLVRLRYAICVCVYIYRYRTLGNTYCTATGTSPFSAASMELSAPANVSITVLLPHAAGPSSMTPVRICRLPVHKSCAQCFWSWRSLPECLVNAFPCCVAGILKLLIRALFSCVAF